MHHSIQSHDSGKASASRGELVCRDHYAPKDRGDAVLPVESSSARSPVRTAKVRWWILWLVLFACVALFESFGSDIGFLPDSCRPGIGDVERAQSKIAKGMSKEEVRSLLGRPHRQVTDKTKTFSQWDYWETVFVGSVLRIEFGPDDRVTSSAWWVD